jgi:hypothetical protein
MNGCTTMSDRRLNTKWSGHDWEAEMKENAEKEKK